MPGRIRVIFTEFDDVKLADQNRSLQHTLHHMDFYINYL